MKAGGHLRPLLLTAVFACAAFAADKTADRVFSFGATESEQDVEEIATAIRSITDMPQLFVDLANRSITVHGDAAQIAAAEWLFNELDKPANRAPVKPGAADPAIHEYKMPGGGEDTIRVLYAPGTATPQQFQELATATRSIVQIRRVFIYFTPRALVFRGTGGLIAMAAWVVQNLDQQPVSTALEYRNPGSADDVVRILYLPHTATVQDFQEVAIGVRSIGDIRSLFAYNAPRALALRGTSGQIAMAAWLSGALDQPQRDASANNEYQMPGESEGVVRVFFLPQSLTLQGLQQAAISVRTKTGIRRMFTYNSARAVMVRGTADQIAMAERLFGEI